MCNCGSGSSDPYRKGNPKPVKVSVEDRYQKLAYCVSCNSVLMTIILANKMRRQCVNHQCRRIQ